MRPLILLMILKSSFVMANVCVCQYAGTDSKYGKGNKGEVPFYKLGCTYWFKEHRCRKTTIQNINKSLVPTVEKRLHSQEKVIIGYVGHWGGSYSTIKYLDNEVLPLLDRFRVSVEVDNTACVPLNDPKLVYRKISSYKLAAGTYLKVSGAQVTSLGLWDNMSKAYPYADLPAVADTRDAGPRYPKCSSYYGKACTKYQFKEYGYCINSKKDLVRLYCLNNSKSKKVWKFK